MPTHTVDYDPETLPLTEKFYRGARPEYFDEFGEYRDFLRNDFNRARWNVIAQRLEIGLHAVLE